MTRRVAGDLALQITIESFLMLLTARKNYWTELSETRKDFVASFIKFPLANNLAIQDILARYRGSVLGPWWITLTMGALVLGIGINYAVLFHQKVEDLLPYVAVGIVFWGFISTTMSEGGEAFVSGGAMLRQSALPLPLFILRTVIRNLINLAHQVIIIIAVFAYFHVFPGLGMVWAIAGLVLSVVNLGWVALALAMVSARFRDVPQIVGAVLQFIFFLSPIFWQPTPAMANNPLVFANPFYFSVQSIREPLLHGHLTSQTFMFLLPMAVLGWVFTLLIYNQTRRRVVHYL